MLQTKGFFRILIVFDFRRDGNCRRVPADRRRRIRPPVRNVQRIRFRQPDMPVNACSFVKPSLVLGRIRANNEHIFVAIVHEIGDVEAKWRVTAQISPEINSIEHDDGVAENAVKFQSDSPAEIALRDFKDAAVPADARFRIFPADRFESELIQSQVVYKRERYGEIMRKINLLPLAVIKLFSRRKKQFRRFCEGTTVAAAKVKILSRIRRISEVKSPVEIER